MFLFSLENVSKSFRSERASFTAVKNVSLELPSTGLISIVGKSGCGKSTLLNLISGIEKPSKGLIKYKSKNLNKFSKRRLAKYHLQDISMVFQHYNLIEDLSVLENIALPLLIGGKRKSLANKKARDYLKRFSLEQLEKQKISTLSGGEKQRVAIIRSLITNPAALLCDEPTGALDEKNSLLVMDELKKISKTKLVLVVSHNKELVDKYSDRILSMNDGEIISDEIRTIFPEPVKEKESKVRHSSGWANLFVKSLFKKNVFKELFSFVSLTIGFISIFIGIGFIEGSEASQKHALERNLELGFATVSETSYFSVTNSPLQFKKNVRPTTLLIDEYLDEIHSIKICPNTSYFFSRFPRGYFLDEQIDGFEMVPLLDEFVDNNTVYPRIAGDFSSKDLTNVIVNKEFLKLISVDQDAYQNIKISIEYETPLTIYTNDEESPFIKDNFSYRFSLKIIDVIDEFSFMNSPKIYYSYNALCDYLKKESLPEISSYLGKTTTAFDYIEESKDDSPESSYSSFVFLKDLSEYQRFFSIIQKNIDNEEILQIDSKVYSISDSYKTFISSFKDALIFFLVIGGVGVLFILGMISLSNFLENKKQSAILTCLGAKNNHISYIYLQYNLLISIFAFIAAVLFSFLIQNSLNSIINNKFGLTNLISIPIENYFGLRYGLFLLVFSIAILCTVLFTILPILAYKNFSISNELRDE